MERLVCPVQRIRHKGQSEEPSARAVGTAHDILKNGRKKQKRRKQQRIDDGGLVIKRLEMEIFGL